MAQPERIVSLVPSTTESVCALGAAPRLVGCTRYCIEPAARLARVPRVGGTKNPALDEIAALEPDLVLGNAEENRAEDLDWLAQRFPVLVQTPTSVAAAAAALTGLGAALGGAAAAVADTYSARIRAQAAAGELLAAQVLAARARPVRVFFAIWAKPWMSVNRTTYIHDVLRLSGAVNVCADDERRYPEVAASRVVARGLDAVLLPSEPWEFDARQRQDLVAAGTFGAAALQLCCGRDFCWHGVRAADGTGRARALVQGLAGACAAG
ncbi:MAG: helical backbone metal receptor [Planctomycetota bacterium]